MGAQIYYSELFYRPPVYFPKKSTAEISMYVSNVRRVLLYRNLKESTFYYFLFADTTCAVAHNKYIVGYEADIYMSFVVSME